jgi:hypothetical protein
MRVHRRPASPGACLLIQLLVLPAAYPQAWTDSGRGFSAGTLGNAGQNLFVNRRGELETIRRYDIDGWPDMLTLKNRFRSPRVQLLPVSGPFYGWLQDVGNIDHRRWDETFTSRVFEWQRPRAGGRLALDAAAPFGARVVRRVRSGPHPSGLAAASWREIAGETFDLPADHRALQYRLDLRSANGDAYPKVRNVDLC